MTKVRAENAPGTAILAKKSEVVSQETSSKKPGGCSFFNALSSFGVGEEAVGGVAVKDFSDIVI